jgi:RNA polymerase sigma-70 factor (ECF subfamily)
MWTSVGAPAGVAASGIGSAVDHADALITRERALSALGRLTEVQREVLLLIAWDGLSQREAAAALGCSRGAVALRVHRARKRLERALQEIADEERAALSAPATANPTGVDVTEEDTT